LGIASFKLAEDVKKGRKGSSKAGSGLDRQTPFDRTGSPNSGRDPSGL